MFGTPPNCVAKFELPGDPPTLIETPMIAKFDFEFGEKGFTVRFTASTFSSIDGSEFAFFPVGEGGTGTFTYTRGTGGPLITAFVAKGGPNFNLFTIPTTLDSFGRQVGTWLTPETCGPPARPQRCGLSHLTFYDTAVPEPASLALLGAGLFGLGLAARRRRSV